MRYPTAEEVAQINADLVGPDMLRDPGLLASAVGRPAQTAFGEEAYGTMFTKVAALFHSIASNHAFLEGNKRTAVVAAIHMLNWNGYELDADDCDVVHITMDAVEHRADVPKIAEFFEEHAAPLSYPAFDEDTAQPEKEDSNG